MRSSVALLLSTIALATTAAPASAQRLYRLELGGSGGYYIFGSETGLNGGFGGAARLGYWIAGPLGIEAEGTFARPTTNSSLNKTVDVKGLAGWALVNFPIGSNNSLFLKLGYGTTRYGGSCPAFSVPGSGPCGSTGEVQAGAGLRIALSPTILMRYEGSISQSQTSKKFSNVGLNAGLSLMLFSQPLIDTDGDRVYDRKDRCPETPPGALVDKRGCPTDRDRDGVPDGLDRCPNTAPGAAVNRVGCATDSDGDGVLDGLDTCESTPAGATVDGNGCPSDADRDGVFDGLDRCPETPEGAKVDGLGCPGDSDNDGVPDGLDRCAGTPSGTSVNSFGCPPGQDSDHDGVLDALDRCPATPAGTGVDQDGCPVGAAPVEPPTPTPNVTPSVKPPGPSTETHRNWMVPGAAFQLRSAALGVEARPILDSVATAMLADSTLTATVQGYAQDRLVPGDNQRLSQQRAEAVRTYLLLKGVAPRRVVAQGRGSRSLIVADTTDVARVTNRRVEIMLQPNAP